MLAGQPPFRGTPAEVMHQHHNACPPLEQMKDVSQPVLALLEVLLAKDPAHRFCRVPGQLLEAMPLVVSMVEAGGSITPQTLAGSPTRSALTTKKRRKFPDGERRCCRHSKSAFS